MAFDLASITSGIQHRPPRIVLLGTAKIGKSTFAAGAPGSVFLPIEGEEGIDSIDVPQFPTCRSYNDVLTCCGSLLQEENPYQFSVLDSASALEPLIWSHLCNQDSVSGIESYQGGYGKGYTAALKEWQNILTWLDALRHDKNMGSIIIGHTKVKRFSPPDGDSYDRWEMDLNERAANLLYRWADLILFANMQIFVQKEDMGFGKERKRGLDRGQGARIAYTQKNPAYPAGGRGIYGQLPPEIPLDFNSFTDALTAIATPQ